MTDVDCLSGSFEVSYYSTVVYVNPLPSNTRRQRLLVWPTVLLSPLTPDFDDIRGRDDSRYSMKMGMGKIRDQGFGLAVTA